jgi:hypothetical protein
VGESNYSLEGVSRNENESSWVVEARWARLSSGSLPAVSFPRYTVLDDGTGNDDHPHADIREDDLFLCQVFQAVVKGPKWPNSVFVVNFDEWGGFFDHVAPPRVTAANPVDTDLVMEKCCWDAACLRSIASPFTKGNPDNHRVSSLLFDHTSVLSTFGWASNDRIRQSYQKQSRNSRHWHLEAADCSSGNAQFSNRHCCREWHPPEIPRGVVGLRYCDWHPRL